YQYVVFRLTDYRPDAYPEMMLSGQDLVHDLGAMIAELARSMPAVPVESVSEPVLTLDEISKKLNVTTKTINRWRKRGLIGLPILVKGRRHVGFLPSLVDPFLTANKTRVEKSSHFSQLTPEEKDEILRRARRFARLGAGSLTEISKRIARRLGRSPETVRYTIKNFDREPPDQAMFPVINGSFDTDSKLVIYYYFLICHPVVSSASIISKPRASLYYVVSGL